MSHVYHPLGDFCTNSYQFQPEINKFSMLALQAGPDGDSGI